MTLRLGSEYVALPRRAMPRCRVARIDSISIFAAGRDAARHNGAMRHIVNLALRKIWSWLKFMYVRKEAKFGFLMASKWQ